MANGLLSYFLFFDHLLIFLDPNRLILDDVDVCQDRDPGPHRARLRGPPPRARQALQIYQIQGKQNNMIIDAAATKEGRGGINVCNVFRPILKCYIIFFLSKGDTSNKKH